MVDQPNNTGNLVVVGVGASAGGLAAFSELLQHLSADTGMAFVLVQHLDPEQTSLLSELLGRVSSLPVQTAADGVAVAANQVYVIPPNAQMTIAQGRLQLTAGDQTRPRRSKTIDLFLQSLATDQQSQAIAILLSGSNDDGAIGLAAVQAAGGITFVQDPDTAEFSEMPDAAIASGQVDFILSPAAIAAELTNISRHPHLRQLPIESRAEPSSALPERDRLTIFRLLQKHTGVDFANYKPNTFQRRLQRRLVLHRLVALADYVQYLQANPAEIQALYQDVLITVTSFFRDAEVYAVLQERVFPALLQQPSAQASIRIWVPGCATGEEAYSLAICLLEGLNAQLMSPTIQIFGTDISDAAIEEARLGLYAENRMEAVSAERRRRFFVKVEGGYQISQAVRELCIFARQDLSSDPPFSDIDLVSCRNVLIYFQPPLQKHALAIFHYSLKPTGLLILGNSESIGDTSELFEVLDGPAKIYTRQTVPTRLSFDFVTSHYQPQMVTSEQQLDLPSSLSRSNLQQWADQMLLNRYAPVGVIVNEKLEILQFRGDTSPYLRPPTGEPSFNLLKMIRPSLLVEVRAAIEAAKQQNVVIQRQQLSIEEAPGEEVAIEVIPLTVSMAPERCCLVLFERHSTAPAAPASLQESNDPPASANLEPTLDRLQQELAATRQELLDTQTFLQLTIQDQENTNQQLIVANEEILSSNEELKSTNEELQTAKEEIQAANEELKTTNEELQNRHAESRQVNDDLLNLINNVNLPILMLSEDLRIRRFTPLMRNLFNLIPSDIGRPISNIRIAIEVPDLDTLIAEVLETLNTIEREVQDAAGHWYLMRIRPYRTVDNRISGVVLVLLDVDTLKQVEQDLRDSQTQLETELFAMNQVQTLSRQLFTSYGLNQALNEVLDVALAIQQTAFGCVQLYHPELDRLEVVVQRGFQPSFEDAWSTMFAHVGLADRYALNSGQPIIIEDIDVDPAYASHSQMAAEIGFRAVQSTPLINRNGEVLGVLSIFFPKPHSTSRRELQVLELYARQASEFVDLLRAQRERQALIEREQLAQAANIRKDEFLTVLSHKLRTPLTGILGWTRLMELGLLNDAESTQAIAAIHKSASLQLRLVEDLLDASQIIQGRFQMAYQPTDVVALLQEAIALVQPQATEKGIQLDANLASSSVLLAVDPERITQVLSNVLSNALKFTPSNGRITIRFTDLPSQVQVQVQDTGCGIAPEVLPDIFDRFHQADASETRRAGGLGLGLFLVRSIMTAHSGTVEIESPGEGQGTTVTITLPRTVVGSVQSPDVTTTKTEMSLAGIRILLVEDARDALAIMTFFLENLGAVVATAQSASEALAIINQEPLDIIVSDIGLPEINGYELVQQVRALPAEQGGQLPAIAITGYASSQDAEAALAAGFQRHIPKPFEFEDLTEAIYSLVGES